MRGLPAPFWWLFAGMLVMASASFVIPFLALFLTARGIPVGTAGLVIALFGAGSLPAGPLSGFLADRFGRRPALLGSLILSAALTAALPWLDSLPALAGGVFLIGLAFHGWWPPSSAVVVDVVAPDRRAEAFGLLHWVRNGGFALSFVVGGLLARSGYTRLFLIDAATTLAFAVLVALRLPETRPASGPEREREPGLRAVANDGTLLALLGLTLVVCLAMFQFESTLPVIMARAGMGTATYGRVMAVNGSLILLLQPWLSGQARRFDQGKVLALAALLVGCGYAIYGMARTAPTYGLGTAVWTLGEILMFPVLPALVAELSPPELRGRYQGAMGLAFGLGLALSPALGTAVLEAAGAATLWAGCALLGVVVALGHLWAGRLRSRAALAPAAA